MIKEIRDLKKFKADIAEGVASILVEATYDVDPSDKYDEIVREVNTVRGDLPGRYCSVYY